MNPVPCRRRRDLTDSDLATFSLNKINK